MKQIILALLLVARAAAAEALASPTDARMAAADIVILGEVHDNPLHHEGQAALIAQLNPKAVVFEMLSAAQADLFNAGPRDDLDGLAERMEWEGSGWPAFAMYRPVFAALGDAPVVGAAVPSDRARAAFDQGAAASFGLGAARFGLDVDLPQAQRDVRQQMQFAAHCAAIPLAMMGGMVEAQRLRDALFSKAALEALQTYGAPVVVITGHGHARRDWGMPAMIKLAAPEVRTFAVGFVEAPGSADDPRFDMTRPTAAARRADPCAGFDRK